MFVSLSLILDLITQQTHIIKGQDYRPRISVTEFVQRQQNTPVGSPLTINTSGDFMQLQHQHQQQQHQQQQQHRLVTAATNMPEVLHASAANSLNTTKYHHNHHNNHQALNSVSAAAAMAMNSVRMSTISPTLSMNGSSNEATNGRFNIILTF